jgi:hypothetical protein
VEDMAKKSKFNASIGVTEQTLHTLTELKIDARVRSLDELLNVLIADYLKGHVSGYDVIDQAGWKANEIANKMMTERPPVGMDELVKTEVALLKRQLEVAKEMQRLHNLRRESETKSAPGAIPESE